MAQQVITEQTQIKIGDWVIRTSSGAHERFLVVGLLTDQPAYELVLDGRDDNVHFGATKVLMIEEGYLLETK